MRVLLFTTTDSASGRHNDFIHMVQSVAAALPPRCTLQHYILLQRSCLEERDQVAAALPYPSIVMWRADRVSLSSARNEMLASALTGDRIFDENTLVAFPDDDCWYPATLLNRVVGAFMSRRDVGLIVGRVSLAPEMSPPDQFRKAGFIEVVRRSSSNCIFVRGDVAQQVGMFDESLGLGTPNRGGEDTDYAIRAYFEAAASLYVDQLLVGHRESDLESIGKYYRGGLLVLSRYAMQGPGCFREFARKIAVGVYLLLRTNLNPGEFWKALQISVSEFGRGVQAASITVDIER